MKNRKAKPLIRGLNNTHFTIRYRVLSNQSPLSSLDVGGYNWDTFTWCGGSLCDAINNLLQEQGNTPAKCIAIDYMAED